MKTSIIAIDPRDNVAVALTKLEAGSTHYINQQRIVVPQAVNAKHKIALLPLAPGDEVYMYGVLVGKTRCHIAVGEAITTENLMHQSAKVSGKTHDFVCQTPDVSQWVERSFMGYHRADGQVGTANVWLFFPLVFCENHNIEILKEVFETELLPSQTQQYRQQLRGLIQNRQFVPDVAEVEEATGLQNIKLRFVTHQGGCGGIRQDALSLARLLAGYVNNPNVAGATVLSLGCQNLQVAIFENELRKLNPNLQKPVLIYEQQKIGTADQMLRAAIADSYPAIMEASKLVRRPAPLSKLVLGLECGGSDGFSGISANPLLGYVSDTLAALRGSVMLAEFPELVGVEQDLVNRCTTNQSAERFLQLMADYEKSVVAAGSGFDMNPSPGNIKDGLITDAMKSAGAAKKGGSSPVVDVLDYGEYVSKPGLSLLCTPGNDVESTTGLVGSGATVVLFTTGLGTPTGNPVSPVIKVSSNTELAERMPDIIDFDAGPIVRGTKSLSQLGNELMEYIIAVASGERETKESEGNHNDFILWKRGVSL